MKKLALIFLAVPLLWGCSKRSPTTTVQSKMIFGEISWWRATAEILAEPTPDPAYTSARARYDTVQFRLSQIEADPGRIVLQSDLVVSPPTGTLCSLVVSSNLGGSRGAVILPGPSWFTRPRDGDTLPRGDVQLSWTPSEGASWFEVQVGCYGYDTLGRWLGYADTVLVVYDTLAVIPAGFLHPASLDVSVYAVTYPHTGSKPGWQTGNMIGEVRGFLIGTGGNGYVFFHVGTPPPGPELWNPGAKPPGPLVSGDRRRAFLLRAFGVE
jgi:hypothetical protein